jgi:hypothetical protein
MIVELDIARYMYLHEKYMTYVLISSPVTSDVYCILYEEYTGVEGGI